MLSDKIDPDIIDEAYAEVGSRLRELVLQTTHAEMALGEPADYTKIIKILFDEKYLHFGDRITKEILKKTRDQVVTEMKNFWSGIKEKIR